MSMGKRGPLIVVNGVESHGLTDYQIDEFFCSINATRNKRMTRVAVPPLDKRKNETDKQFVDRIYEKGLGR